MLVERVERNEDRQDPWVCGDTINDRWHQEKRRMESREGRGEREGKRKRREGREETPYLAVRTLPVMPAAINLVNIVPV